MWSVFVCKQKTAYERRMSDWSSDVCSSDLLALLPAARQAPAAPGDGAATRRLPGLGDARGDPRRTAGFRPVLPAGVLFRPSAGDSADVEGRHEIGRASCRESLCQYESISVVAVSSNKNTK